MNPKQIEFVRKIYNEVNKEVVSKKELEVAKAKLKDELPLSSSRFIEDGYKVTGKRGHYRLPIEAIGVETDSVEISQTSVKGKVEPKAEVEVEEIFGGREALMCLAFYFLVELQHPYIW